MPFAIPAPATISAIIRLPAVAQLSEQAEISARISETRRNDGRKTPVFIQLKGRIRKQLVYLV